MNRSVFRRFYIFVTWPIVMGAYKLRDHRRFMHRYPRIWRTPGQIIHLDLDNYESEGDEFKLDKKFADDLAVTRNEARGKAFRIIFINTMIFAFLVSDYFSIGLSFTIPGISITDKKGVREFLLLYTSISSIYTLILQNNIYILETSIKYIILNKFPIELRSIFMSKYFYFENFSRAFPVSLPHISFSRIQFNGFILLSILFIFSMLLYYFLYVYMYILICIDVWISEKLGIWSHIIAGASIINGILGALYLAFTRLLMPYRDYTLLQEITHLPDIAPSQVERRRNEIYGEGTADWLNLIDRGYIKAKPKASTKDTQTPPL